MRYLKSQDAIKEIVNLLDMEKILPIIGTGFSWNMLSCGGQVPRASECTDKMKQLLIQYAPELFDEEKLKDFNFNDTSEYFRKMAKEKGVIPETVYISFFRDNFTGVHLDKTRVNVLKLPWNNVYTINVDDGIENTGIYHPILPYQNFREESIRNNSVFKLHGDAAYEVNYQKNDNIVFDQIQYQHVMENKDNETIRNNVLTAFREFNIIYIGCGLENEPDLKKYYTSVKKEKANTKIYYLTRHSITPIKEMQLEEYGVTDIVNISDYEAFYIDLVYEFNASVKATNTFPYYNPKVDRIKVDDIKLIFGQNQFREDQNRFIRPEVFIDRSVEKEVEARFKKKNVVVLAGRRFSGRTSLMAQICKNEKTRGIYFFPSSSSFDYRVVKGILESEKPALLLFDSNAMQPAVYLGIYEMEELIKKNNHHLLIVEALEDTYLTENIDCEVINLPARFEQNELTVLNTNLDKYGLINRKDRETNLDYLTNLKCRQKIDFPTMFNLPKRLSDIESRLLLVLAAQDKIFSRDIHMMGIDEENLKSILERLDRLCEKVHVAKGESHTQSSYKIVHNSRALVLYLLKEAADLSIDVVSNNIKILIQTFYQNKDRMQKQIAISIMQFDTLNEVYGHGTGAGRLIEKVYEELQDVLNGDPHYWLQRSKSVYRLNPKNVDKLLEAYRYCVKAGDGNANSHKLEAQVSLSHSLITGLLSIYTKDDGYSYAEECIRMGYNAINSEYYINNHERLEKEKAGSDGTYESLCIDVCNKYLFSCSETSNECREKARKIISMLEKSDFQI